MAYFNYRNLDPTEFEALAKDVMERILGCSLNRYGPGPDDGVDLCDDRKHIIVQCKRYQQGSFGSMYSVLKNKERLKIDKLDPRPEQYYVFTSLELLPQQKEKILNLFQEYMKGESCIVDGITINDFFRDERNHDLISRNIKLFISLPENYKYNQNYLLQIKANRLYNSLLSIFENDRKNHPSIRMMNPDPSLFPKGLPEVFSDGRLAAEDKEAPRAIRDMIRDSWKREDQRHILLIGEGGIGKTVAMLTLPVEDWFKKLGIPVIYVPLQRLDAYRGDLNRYIREKIRYDNYDRCIELANSIPEGHPNLLLLLDGFNEIPDKYKKSAEKCIREWMDKPGNQIITTSRMGFFLENRFLKYRLLPLQFDTVKSFLLSAGIAEEQLPRQNDKFWEIINVPLMLTLYTQIEKVKEVAEHSFIAPILEWKAPDNAAHIIWNYLQTELYRYIEKDDSAYSPTQYAVAILMIAPYICCQMSRQNKFYIKRARFHELIGDALIFFNAHQDILSDQILNVCEEFDPYPQENLFNEEQKNWYASILIDNIALFQVQRICAKGLDNDDVIEYLCSLMHQNFRDAFAAFFICSCLSKTYDAKEKRALLGQADYYVKDYMAEYLSDQELVSVWDQHRKEDPAEGQITFILMDLIGRQRNYDYRELDFSGIDLTKTNLHRLLSKRLDICPLPEDRNKFRSTKLSVYCLSPISYPFWVNSVAFSPDGRLFAIGTFFGTVHIWDIENGTVRTLKQRASCVATSIAFSPDGKLLASGGYDMVRVWDVESGKSRVLEGFIDTVNSVAFSPDGRLLASGGNDNTVRIWYLESGKSRVLSGLTSHTDEVSSVAFSPDGRLLASGSYDSTVRIWDLESISSDSTLRIWDLMSVELGVRVLKGHADGVRSIAFSPDGRLLASGGKDNTVRIWDLESGKSRVLKGLTSHTDEVNSVAFSPDGRLLASGADDSTVRIWDLASGENRVLKGHTGEVMSVAFSLDGRQLASGSFNGLVRLWDLESAESRVLEGYIGSVQSVTFSPDGRLLASGANDSTVRIWDLESAEHRILEGHIGNVESVAFSPDGRLLASGSYDRTVRIWNLASAKSRVLKGHAGNVESVAFSPDGRQFVSGSSDSAVRIWNLVSGESRVLEGHANGVKSVAFSPDGRLLASGSSDSAVRIWNLVSGESRVLEGHANGFRSVAFSPDGRLLARGTVADTVQIWDLESGKSRVLKGHVERVSSVAFSPDGRLLASGSFDSTVRIWDLESGESRVLEGHIGMVNSVAFSPDGRLLASGSFDSTVRIWDLEKYHVVCRYAIIAHINLNKANFELANINKKDIELLSAAGARCNTQPLNKWTYFWHMLRERANAIFARLLN